MLRDLRTEIIKKRYNRVSPFYDFMDKMIKETWRKELFQQVRGNVLEVGIGTGANLSYYPKDILLTGIDFSPGMLNKARDKVKRANFPFEVNLLEMDAQEMTFDDNTFDYVVATCVYCSVPNPVQGLIEMARVCKPDGKILLLEHMRSENQVLGMLMDMMNPLTVSLWGANINRKTIENVQKAALIIQKDEKLMGSVMRRLVLTPNK